MCQALDEELGTQPPTPQTHPQSPLPSLADTPVGLKQELEGQTLARPQELKAGSTEHLADMREGVPGGQGMAGKASQRSHAACEHLLGRGTSTGEKGWGAPKVYDT